MQHVSLYLPLPHVHPPCSERQRHTPVKTFTQTVKRLLTAKKTCKHSETGNSFASSNLSHLVNVWEGLVRQVRPVWQQRWKLLGKGKLGRLRATVPGACNCPLKGHTNRQFPSLFSPSQVSKINDGFRSSKAAGCRVIFSPFLVIWHTWPDRATFRSVRTDLSKTNSLIKPYMIVRLTLKYFAQLLKFNPFTRFSRGNTCGQYRSLPLWLQWINSTIFTKVSQINSLVRRASPLTKCQ